MATVTYTKKKQLMLHLNNNLFLHDIGIRLELLISFFFCYNFQGP